jgi:antitoxin CptB
MSGLERTSAGLDARRRRILFRAWHRGMREVDLILGPFADAEVAALSEAEVDDLERLMDVPDPEVLAWLMGERPVAREHDTPLWRRLTEFHTHRAPIHS